MMENILKTVFYFLLGVIGAQAQTRALLPAPEPVVVTNRDVFKDTMAVPQKIERRGVVKAIRGDVLECRSNAVIVQTFEMKNLYGPAAHWDLPRISDVANPLYETPAMRPVIGQKKKFGAILGLQHFRDAASLTNGQEISCRAVMAGTCGWRDSLVELYDCVPTTKNGQ